MNFQQEENQPHDSGMTLIELLVSMVLGLIVVALLATMMIGVYGTQNRVTLSSGAAAQAQVVSEVFRSAVRSSTYGSLSDVTLAGSTGQLLVLRSLDRTARESETPTAKCVAVYWKKGASPSTDSISWASANSAVELPAPAGTGVGAWQELIIGLTPLSLTSPPPVPAPGVFIKNGNTYTLTFTTEPKEGPKASIRVSVSSPNLAKEIRGNC